MEAFPIPVIHTDTEEAYTNFKVSGFWPNTDNPKIVFSHSGLHKIQINSHEQSTITLEPFWSGCTNQAQKKEKEVDFLLSLSHIKIVLCKSIETQEISGFASRQSRRGESWEEFTATPTHLEMMSSREKKQYALCSFPLLANRVQVPWL